MNAFPGHAPSACDRDLSEALTLEAARDCLLAFAAGRERTETIGLDEAAGRVLAQDLRAAKASPPYDRAAMDGFALRVDEGLDAGARLPLRGRLQAGGRAEPLAPGCAIEIFTGAPVPPGADAVVAREDAERDGQFVTLRRRVADGDHIRRRGEDAAAGALLLAAGTVLDARHVALLAADGLARVEVRARPRVAILSTGDELAEAGSASDHAVHDANRPMLIAMARAASFEPIDGGIVRDDPGALARRLAELAAHCDAVVLSGGAARSDADHTATAIEDAGGVCRRLTLAVKPGKPLVAGRIGETLVIGLPGNPLAAFVSFAFVARPALDRLAGRATPARTRLPALLAEGLTRRTGRKEFLPARIVAEGDDLVVRTLPGNSGRLLPLCDADGLVEIPADWRSVAPGARVAFHPFAMLLGG
jgi:molybdopterin molybdotransferase